MEIRELPPMPPLLKARTIDVMVWGASRPALLERTISSFREHVKFSGDLRFFLEDGDFDPVKAQQSAAFARGAGFVDVHVERVGSYGFAMTNAIARWARAPLMLSLEDDWLCVRDIDLDLCFDAFVENPWLNQLRYNRRKNVSRQSDEAFVTRDLAIGGAIYPCMSSRHWFFNPAVWRLEYIWPRWKGAKDNVHHFMNSSRGLLPPGERPSPDWYADKLGAITWGPPREPAFFEHIGREASIHAAQGRV